jgi:AcrR family transcriptional regulator
MGRPKKALISRRKALELALKIIDKEGLDALSIRRLGDELGVRGISLYHHFASKEDILIGVCELALTDIRTPHAPNADWRQWFADNVGKYYQALLDHPNLIPVLMRRHPLRIGLREHNATVGLLAVQGVPIGVIMPLFDMLESIALGCAAYQSAVNADTDTDNWHEKYSSLYQVRRSAELSPKAAFEATIKAAIDAILSTYNATAGHGAAKPAKPPRKKSS